MSHDMSAATIAACTECDRAQEARVWCLICAGRGGGVSFGMRSRSTGQVCRNVGQSQADRDISEETADTEKYISGSPYCIQSRLASGLRLARGKAGLTDGRDVFASIGLPCRHLPRELGMSLEAAMHPTKTSRVQIMTLGCDLCAVSFQHSNQTMPACHRQLHSAPVPAAHR